VHVSRETVVAAKRVLQDGAPEFAQAVEAGTLTVSAAVPLTALPREGQLTALQEAQHEATGKRPQRSRAARWSGGGRKPRRLPLRGMAT
jgi:hypothetical protein